MSRFYPVIEFQTPFGITACENTNKLDTYGMMLTFQTPFGITACESEAAPTSRHNLATCFKRLSASLHVKGLSPT